MIEAELKNKIDRTEDVLTSTVFGYLKYNFMKHCLKAFLGKARKYYRHNYSFETELTKNNILEAENKFVFWKNIAPYGQPDLIIEGNDSVVLVEVKYLSPLSSPTQLIDYYNILETEYRDVSNKYLVFLTADLDFPELPQESVDGLKDKNFYWLSWYDFYKTLTYIPNIKRDAMYEVAVDLLKILKERDLSLFEGFSNHCHYKDVQHYFWKNKSVFFSSYNNIQLKNPVFWRNR